MQFIELREILKDFQNRMIKLFEKAIEEDGHCKCFEPSITFSIHLDNEMKVSYVIEIYSYRIEYKTTGRHHTFESPDLHSLLNKVDKAIAKQEEIWK